LLLLAQLDLRRDLYRRVGQADRRQCLRLAWACRRSQAPRRQPALDRDTSLLPAPMFASPVALRPVGGRSRSETFSAEGLVPARQSPVLPEDRLAASLQGFVSHRSSIHLAGPRGGQIPCTSRGPDGQNGDHILNEEIDENRGTRTDQLRPHGLLEKPTNLGRLAYSKEPRRRRFAPLSMARLPIHTWQLSLLLRHWLRQHIPNVLPRAITCFALIEIAGNQLRQISVEDTLGHVLIK
jgi:hypothetical protein